MSLYYFVDTQEVPTAKPTNPEWPLIKKQLESLGIPLTTAAPGETAGVKPNLASLLKSLSTANDPAVPASPFASVWPSISKDLTKSGIPISPLATMTPESWLQMKGSLMGTAGAASGKPFWASFMTPKADPPAAGGGQPFWMSFIKPKPTSAPPSGFVPGAVSNFIPAFLPPGTGFGPAPGAFIPAPGAFIPAPVSNLLPMKTAFIPGGPSGGGMPPLLASYLSQMSDPPAATATGSELLPLLLAASMQAKKPGSPAAGGAPWASPYMGGFGSSPYAFMMPTPTPKPNAFLEYLKSAKKDPKLSASLPWWASLIKEKPTPTPAPNPFLDIMKQYMSKTSPGNSALPVQSKPAAPETVKPNPFLDFLKQYISKTSPGQETVAGQSKPTAPETPQIAATTPPPPPAQVPADLWAEFLKSYMSTAGAASGTR